MVSLSLPFLLLLSTLSLSSSQNIISFTSSNSPWRTNSSLSLISPNSTFAAGFLQNNNSNTFSFSIWYQNFTNKIVVWSLNSNGLPLTLSSTASLAISNSTGNLTLTNSSSSNTNLLPSNSTCITGLALKEGGNLVCGGFESYNLPSDTFLPGQEMAGLTLTSRNGKFKLRDGSSLVFDSMNDTYWTPPTPSTFEMLNLDGSVASVDGGASAVISADFGDPDRLRRLSVDNDGNLRIYSCSLDGKDCFVSWLALQELCKVHGVCGANAICMNNGSDITTCECPPGFAKNTSDPESCVRKISLNSSGGTKFERLDYVNFTGGSNQSNLNAKNFNDCRSQCDAKPNCLGFMFKYDGKGYCVLQLDRMLFGYWSPGTETAMFLRLNNAETDVSQYTGMTSLLETTCPVNISLPLPPDESNTTARNIAIICTLFAAELIAGVLFFWAFLKKYIKYRDMARTLGLELLPTGGPKRFSHAELKAATNDFSTAIGKGGFGDVYRGELSDKRIVAVKCLKNVTGGDTEFWAEVTIIARMHHLNLVRLWGFCAEKNQRILVYEYVPNGSLDKYLFPAGRVAPSGPDGDMGPVAIDGRKPMLDWGIRYRIALGVARAIAYLHEECLEWVLHCDIKPENILLGDDFCPKISDFGLAKLRRKEDMVSMSRIRGTRGYMAPEWVRSDPITPKADVYSFGMVLLEIVTGSRNFEMQGSLMDSEDWYFPRWAFDKVFKEVNVEDILDRQIKHCYDARLHFDMVDRMVKTAMWCLQDRPDMRPSMGKVAKMLEGTVEITEPKKPTIFFLGDE